MSLFSRTAALIAAERVDRVRSTGRSRTAIDPVRVTPCRPNQRRGLPRPLLDRVAEPALWFVTRVLY